MNSQYGILWLECRRKHLRHWSMPSPITLCSTPAHTSISCCLKSFTFYACMVNMLPKDGTRYEKLGGRKIFAAALSLFQFAPLVGGHAFVPLALGHACCDHNESESYRPTIIRRHCVDQQTDSLVVTEFQSDHREWSHWKREVKDQFSPPCIEIWRGIRPPGPTACSTPDVAPFCTQLDYDRDVLRPQIWKIIWVTIISEIITLLDCRQWMMHSMSE